MTAQVEIYPQGDSHLSTNPLNFLQNKKGRREKARLTRAGMGQTAAKIAITGAEIYPWSDAGKSASNVAIVEEPKDVFLGWNRAHPDAKITHFQVFGERRSGTNFANATLGQNLKLRKVFNYGWKHGFPVMPAIKRDALIVAIFRDPISWLISLHNRPFSPSHRGLEFSEFLRTPWYDIYRPKQHGHNRFGFGGMPSERGVHNQLDRHPITGKEFANPLEMRSLKYASYRGFLERNCNVVLLDYDALKNRSGDVFDAVAERFDITKTHDNPQAIKQVGPKGKPVPRQVASEISAEDLDFIRANLDEPLERELGFGSVFYETPL